MRPSRRHRGTEEELIRVIQGDTGSGVVIVNAREVGRITARHGIVEFVDHETMLRRRFVGIGELRRWLVALYVW